MNNDEFNNIPTPMKANKEEPSKLEVLMKDSNVEVNTLSEGKEALKKETNSLITFFKDFYKYVTTHKMSELAELLVYAVIIAGFMIILSIPFAFVKELFFNILVLFSVNFDQTIQNIFAGVWDAFYFLVAIFLFLILCKEKFYQMIANKKEIEDLRKEINK